MLGALGNSGVEQGQRSLYSPLHYGCFRCNLALRHLFNGGSGIVPLIYLEDVSASFGPQHGDAEDDETGRSIPD